jgi:hypothetical protein
MASRRVSQVQAIPEPEPTVEEDIQEDVLSSIDITDEEVEENEAIAFSAVLEEDEPDIQVEEIVEVKPVKVDKSVVASSSGVSVTYVGLKEEVSVPAVIQIVIPVDGADYDGLSDYGDFVQLKLNEPKTVTATQAEWLKGHPFYKIV